MAAALRSRSSNRDSILATLARIFSKVAAVEFKCKLQMLAISPTMNDD